MFPPNYRQHAEEYVRMSDVSNITESVSEVAASQIPARDKILRLFASLGKLVGQDLDFHLLLFDSVDRKPAPQIVDRVTYGPTYEVFEPRPLGEVQEVVDLCGSVLNVGVPRSLSRPRTPVVLLYSEDADPTWFRNVFSPYVMRPLKWADCIACYWAGGKDRVIMLSVFRKVDQPEFSARHRQMLSLLTRAIAPLIDRELFLFPPMDLADLDERLRPILSMVLQGASDYDIAQTGDVPINDASAAVRKLCDHFNVRHRGEILARFVDNRVLNWLEEKDA